MKTCAHCGSVLYVNGTATYRSGLIGTRYKCSACKKCVTIKQDGTLGKIGRPMNLDFRFLHTFKTCGCGGKLVCRGTGKRWLKTLSLWKFVAFCTSCGTDTTYYTDGNGVVQRTGALPAGRRVHFEMGTSNDQRQAAA